MKKIALLSICLGALLMILPACNGNKLKEAQVQNTELTDSLQTAMAQRDSIDALMSEVLGGLNQINEMEKLIVSPGLSGETKSKKDEIKDNITLIQMALKERRDKLDAMEAKLKNSNNYSGKIQKDIEQMKLLITNQEAKITELTQALQEANVKIDGLNKEVSTLNKTVDNVSAEKKAAQEEAIRVANELNACYYVIGSKGELKKSKIIESGFLKKTKIMEGDFEKSYFTKADKRTLTTLPLNSKKAKLLSKHPQGSYTIADNDGVKSLEISNPTKFWELSNFLIVQID